MTTLPLTADSIAALQQQVGQPVDEQAALRWLVDQEASVARREHVLALLREYHQLQALSPTEASGYVERREANAARRLQKAWRRRGSRRSFLEVVHRSQLHRQAKAATTIQRAQRTRQHVVAEAAPPISKELLQELQKDVVAKTIAMAKELKEARAKQEAWRATGGSDAELAASAAEAVPGTAAAAAKPSLPAWFEKPEWERDLEQMKPGGSAAVFELRDDARRGLHADRPQAEMVRAIRKWPQLRARLQAAAVKRQVARTQAAALHAQLRYPPPLPPAPPSTNLAAPELALPPVLPSKPAVLAAHRRLLRAERLKIEVEEQEEEALEKAATAAVSPRGSKGGEARPPLTPNTRERGAHVASSLGAQTHALSSAELIWLASLERPVVAPLSAPPPALAPAALTAS